MFTARPTPAPTRQLPEHPNLDQLRRQAKDLLENVRSGDPHALAELALFEHNAGLANFALHDAQRILARAYGYPSWPKLKAFVDGASIARFAAAVQAGDIPQVRVLLAARPELVGMDRAENDEHRALHYAVLRNDAAMVKLLMEAGADGRKGIFPHRDATSALAIARDRELNGLVQIMEEEERQRREEMSCPNATVSPIQDQISAAILQGDTATAIHLLEADLTLIQACDRDGASPLHIAAQAANAQLVAWLREKRANPRKKDQQDLTPLDRAALAVDPRNKKAARFPEVARLLLEHGAELTIRAAVALGDLPSIHTIIEKEPNLLRQIGGDGGLLTLAVKHAQFEVATLLLDLGADVDERILLEQLEEPTPSWGMPLWHAAFADNLPMCRLLLDRGADPNANVYASGWPLNNAWNHPGGAIRQLLLDRGATIQPYMIAQMHLVEEARRMLADNPTEHVVNEFAWSAADHGCPEILELALPFLDLPPTDPRWHWILIQPIRGAGPSHGNESSDNQGHFQCMAAILSKGADPNIARFGQTILHFTAARQSGLSGADRARFATMLIDHGARLDLRDDLLQSTPLGWACRWGHVELVELLLQRGAPAREPDAQPWATPAAWARKMHHPNILAILAAATS